MAIDKIVAEYRLELDGLRQDVNNLKGQLKSVDDSVNKSADNTNKKIDDIGNNVGGKLPESFKRLGAAIAAAFAVERIANFAVEAVNLAAKAEGIKRAFDKLNQPNLLDELRTATKGTVSDLQLMTTAVKASNFKLPLDQLARLLKFAQQRAIETGDSIDYLVESIVLGISRKSIPILDNLGLSASEVQNEFQKTGDMAVAVGNIIDKSMGNAADATLTMAERQAQLRTSFENLKEDLGTLLIPVFEGLITVIQGSIDKYTELFNRLKSNTNSFQEEYAQTIEYAKQHEFTLDQLNAKADLWNRKMNETSGKESELYQARRDAYNDLIFQLEKSGQTQLKNTTNASNATSNQIGLLEQLKQEIDALTELQNKSNDPAEIKNYTIEIDKLQNRIKELTTVNNGNNKSQEDTNKILQENIKALQDYVKLFGQPAQTAEGYEKIIQDNIKGLTEYVNLFATIPAQTAEGYNQTIQNNLNGLQDYVDLFSLGFVEANGDTLEDAKMQWEDYFYSVMRIADSVYTMFNALDDNRLENLKDRLDRGLISQEQYDDELKKIQEEQARRQKVIALFQAAIDIPLAILKGLKDYGPVGAAIAAGVGFANLATIAVTSLPAFKDGVIDFKGKGTGTSDSNLALISRGESIITAKATRKHKDVLEAIQKDKFDEYVMKIYANQIKEKQKDGVNHELQELLYRQLLISNKQIKEDKENTKEIVSAIEKRPHRF